MRVQALFLALSAIILLASNLGTFGSLGSSWALAAEEPRCFDLTAKVDHPLHPLLRKALQGVNKKSSGELGEDTYWGASQGVVKSPINEVFQKLLDHNTTKSSRVSKMEVKKLSDPNYLARHRVHFEVHPFPFITVEWDEDWGYALVRGTAESPQEIVISYEKISGTSYIKHLCGSIVLRSINTDANTNTGTMGSTDVFLYEETHATNRTQEDVMQGLVGTLNLLQKSPQP